MPKKERRAPSRRIRRSRRAHGRVTHIVPLGLGALAAAYAVAAPSSQTQSPLYYAMNGDVKDLPASVGTKVIPFSIPGLSSGNVQDWGPVWGLGATVVGLKFLRKHSILPNFRIGRKLSLF